LESKPPASFRQPGADQPALEREGSSRSGCSPHAGHPHAGSSPPVRGGRVLSLSNATVGEPGHFIGSPTSTRSSPIRSSALRRSTTFVYTPSRRFQAGARPVACRAPEPPLPRQGVGARLHPAAVHHPDGALDARVEVDVRSDFSVFNWLFWKLHIINSRINWLGDPDLAMGSIMIRERLARRAVLRHQPARRPADHQSRSATSRRDRRANRCSASGT